MALADHENPPSLYPDDLLTHPVNGTSWWVAHTRSRREKSLAGVLERTGIGYFLPFRKRRQPSRNRTRHSTVCLFPGYLFFCGDALARMAAIRSHHVTRILSVPDPVRLVGELLQIHKALLSGYCLYPQGVFTKGMRVRVKQGPLEGIEGVIDQRRGAGRLLLRVSFIGQAVGLDVNEEVLERA